MVGEEGGSFDQMRFATVDGVGLVISWVCGLAVRWSGRSGLGGDVGTVVMYFLPWLYLSAVWLIRDLDDEVGYSLDGESVELQGWGCFYASVRCV